MIYRIREDDEHFMVSDIGPAQLKDAYKVFPKVKVILDQPNSNISLQDVWIPIDVNMVDASHMKKGTPLPDITTWQSGLVLMPKALDYLQQKLEPYGEFLQATCNDQLVSLFSCLTFGREDMSQCIFEYLDGIPVGLEHLVFDDSDVSNKLIFKSKEQRGQFLYCGEKLKALCEQHDLKGLRFDSDLLAIFL